MSNNERSEKHASAAQTFAPIEKITHAGTLYSENAPTFSPSPSGPVSLWLYVAGLCATLSGLYAVNFGMDDPNFAQMTYLLAIGGYVTSYVLRAQRVKWQYVILPALLVCVFVVLLSVSQGDRIGWLVTTGAISDRPKRLEMAIALLAIIHTYTLAVDAAVLFGGVFCISMISLASWTTADPDIQNAFLVFVCAATFMMVHENYLRTRATTVQNRTPGAERKLFNGQLQLVGVCFVGALILAEFVAVPIRTVGQSLFAPGSFPSLNAMLSRARDNRISRLSVSEKDSMELATGPTSESDLPLLKVRCSCASPNLYPANRLLYWRGTTFDFYTGHSFVNSFEDRPSSWTGVEPNEAAEERRQRGREYRHWDEPEDGWAWVTHWFHLPEEDDYDVSPERMLGRVRCVQNFTVMGGSFEQIYGAGNITDVQAPCRSLEVNSARNIKVKDIRSERNVYAYTVTSELPDSDPQKLRDASMRAIPPEIQRVYLQTPDANTDDTQRLRELAARITRGLVNRYDKTVAIQRYIAATCKYNLQAPAAPKDRDIVANFLFESQQGYCDSFAASLTMLCRYAGIPARLASGFATGDMDPEGDYVVRQKHKHAWTEVYFPQVGWATFEATEGAEDISDHSGKNAQTPHSLMAWLSAEGWGPATILGLVALALLYVFKTEVLDRLQRDRTKETRLLERPPTNTEIIRLYLTAGRQLARFGYPRPPEATPDEYAGLVAGCATGTVTASVSEALQRLTALCTRFRYGREVASDQDVAEARGALEALNAALTAARRA